MQPNTSMGRALRVGPRKRTAVLAVAVLVVAMLLAGAGAGRTAVVLVAVMVALAAGFLVVERRRRAEQARLLAEEARRRRKAATGPAQRKLARQVRAAATQSRRAARDSKRAAARATEAVRLARRAPKPVGPARARKPVAPAPVEAPSPWLNPAWLGERLWAGFTTDALEGLLRLTVNRQVSPGARGRAFLELARWHGADGRHEQALEMARLARVADPSLARSPLQPALEAEFLIGCGLADEARELLQDPRTVQPSEADRLLRLANTYSPTVAARWQPTDELRRLGLVNQVFLRSGFLPLAMADTDRPLGFDNLASPPPTRAGRAKDARVTVLMPAYNAADVLERALRSVLAQTWRNLEVVVVDDASVDSTREVVEAVAERDARVRLVRQPRNLGAYAARNSGLREATGDLVTVHDSDDWSHPQKIETLAQRLSEDPGPVAALAHHVRAFADLTFTVPSIQPSARLVALNWSSLMVRRKVFDEVGVWDMVRAAGDSELLRRLEAYYGEDALARLESDVPLSFSMVAPTSLTSSPRTGFPSLWQALGARRQYRSTFLAWHASASFRDDLPLSADRTDRPVVAPALLRVDREAYCDRFDVVMLSDFTLPGGTTASNIEEIQAQVRGGLRVGLLQHRRRDGRQSVPLNRKLASVVDGDRVRLLSNGERVGCDVLTVRYPRAVEHLMDEMPEVKARNVEVIVNQLPLRLYGVAGERATYDIATCQHSLEQRFGSEVTWHPIGPVVRRGLLEHHAAELAHIRLAPRDWVNVIDAPAWRRAGRRPPDGRVRIGRHARDASEKWPEDVGSLRASYPDRPGYEVHVLGGASVPTSLLGTRPDGWIVHPFDAVPVREFLHGLDVYVYQAHTRWAEAFGRSLLEALAAGLPVVTAPAFEPLFGPAAIYAEPHEVLDRVDALMSDEAAYDAQVRRANAVVEERFSHAAHLHRLRGLGVGVARSGLDA